MYVLQSCRKSGHVWADGKFMWKVLCICSCGYVLRCMECQRGLRMRKVSIRPSVCLSIRLPNAWIVTKWKKDLSRFVYETKDYLA